MHSSQKSPELAAFFDLDSFRGSKTESDRRHEIFVSALRTEVENVRFDVPLRDFTAVKTCPLAYGRVGLTAHIFRKVTPADPTWCVVAQGLATADDGHFVRCWWEVPIDRIGKGNDWVSFAKGGDFSRFYEDNHLVVLWTDSSRRKMEEIGRVQNVQHYFKVGITWSYRSVKGFSPRYLSGKGIHGHVGHSAFPRKKENLFFLLGCFASKVFEFLLGLFSAAGKHEVGMVKKVPIPYPGLEKDTSISDLAKGIYQAKEGWDSGNEISTNFKRPWLLREDIVDPAISLTERLEVLAEFESAEDATIQELYAQLNEEVYDLYGIIGSARKVIEETLAERPREIIWPQMEGKAVEQKRMEHVWRLLSYAVKRVVDADEDGIVPFLPVADESSLLDRVYQGLEELFPNHSVSHVEVETVNELKRKVKGFRSVKRIQEWIDDVFFQYHVSLYKNRPVIWHISSTQGKGVAAFGALVHYHKFDKNGMAKLRGVHLRDAIEFFRRETALAAHERREDDRLEWEAKLEETEELDRRLQLIQEGYHEGPEGSEKDFRILTPWKSADKRPKGWDPDLDDGVKVNIEPLQQAQVLRIAKVV